MARKFRKRPDLHMVVIPGVGRIRDYQVIEGDAYARYVPHLLEEVPETPSAPPPPPPPPPSAPPPPPAVAAVMPVPVPEAEAPTALEPFVEPVTPVAEPDDSDDGDSEDDSESEEEDVGAETSVLSLPQPRKRGRPKKVR